MSPKLQQNKKPIILENIMFSLFDFRRHGDEKSVYSRWLYHLNFLSTMAVDRKMD